MGITIIHAADWHIGDFKGPERDGVNLRSLDTRRCLEFMAARAEQERPNLVLVPGDIFHAGKTWSERCCDEVVVAIGIISRLAAAAGQVVVMRGTPNHDGAGPFKVLGQYFAGWPNVHIVTTPQVVRTDWADIAALPGFEAGVYRAQFPGLGREEENEAISRELGNMALGLRAECRADRPAILMAHYTVPGCNTEGGQSQTLTQFEPIIPSESLSAAGYGLVALGHIHRPQMVPGLDNVYYSGSINANNFNDEGQERGFWIHHMEQSAVSSEFVETPYREFITFNMTDTDITAINLGCMDDVAQEFWRWNGGVQDRIVRVRYSCSAENAKGFNRAALERTLLEDGAFMVAEILPEDVGEFANRTELAGTMAPEANLVRYLEEKQVPPDKIQELVAKARPVIEEAEAGMPTAVGTGMFMPVEISVKNYRNYEDETFRFDDVTFCTINGQNGAGKSSLFMDAIIDCLYEQPREGIIKDEAGKSPWLRNDASVRSGSIMFTFRIGERKYRVTRTRARSGKGTLNISCLAEGDWVDCSEERYNDTQQKILDIIGMDSFTFKSCALIMQDQYGLFLQAKPEERVEVLGTLLGLGIYQGMERIAQDKAKAYGARNRELKQKAEIHHGTISSLGDPDRELEGCQAELEGYEEALQVKAAERDRNKLLLANCQEAAERRRKLLSAVSMLEAKKAATGQNRATQQAIIDSCEAILDSRQEIEAKVAEHKALMERERQLAGESALYSAKRREAEGLASQSASEQSGIYILKAKLVQREADLSSCQPTEQDAEIKENAAEYERQKKLLDEAYEQERAYRAVEQKHTEARYELHQVNTRYALDMKNLQLEEDSLKKKAELLSNVECVDISQARCGFLADAVSARQALEDFPKRYADLNKAYEEQVIPINQQVADSGTQMKEMLFDAGEVAAVSARVASLKPYVAKLEDINQRAGRIALLEAELEYLRSNISEAERRHAEAEMKAIEAAQERDRYARASEEHGQVLGAIAALAPWLEKERQLPVAEERRATAMGRVLELATELADIEAEIAERQAEADREVLVMAGMEGLAETVSRMDAEVDAISALAKRKQMELGALRQKAEQMARLKEEAAALQGQAMEYAKGAADYEALKAAFSQSGIPHQIVRSVIPQLTATSNAILGQMTGGKMGVELHLEKLQKNGKEKESLDIFIEEYGKPALPYLSKSGGEKVKSSLSVILALSEVKASTAGIQLGFLLIDEPPFLDPDGTHAYVDALEAIRQRYPGLKVMAITHDQEFKARFPQSVTVHKDGRGSHVRWD